jgi:hypothetical protein
VPKEHGGSANALAEKMGNVFAVLRRLIAARYVRRFAMTAHVRRVNMPAQAEGGNEGQKYLPAAPESVEEHEGRAIGGALSVIQFDFAGVEGVLDESRMAFV